MNEEEGERITRVEVEVDFLKRSFGKVEAALTQLAADMHALAIADAKRTEDRKTIERLFEQLDVLAQRVETVNVGLAGRIEDIEKQRLQEQREATAKEADRRHVWLMEAAKQVAAFLVAIALYHFGLSMTQNPEGQPPITIKDTNK